MLYLVVLGMLGILIGTFVFAFVFGGLQRKGPLGIGVLVGFALLGAAIHWLTH